MTLRDWLLLLAMLGLYLTASGMEPRPTAMTGTTGTATYCAPTPDYCQGWGGDAHLGAVRSFTFGDRPYGVRVCRTDVQACTSVRVVSHCACGGDTVIDLSVAAFRELGPLALGRVPVQVTVERGGPTVTTPPTDTAP
jgi:hypothetical protein